VQIWGTDSNNNGIKFEIISECKDANHTFFYSTDHRLFSCGVNDKQQCLASSASTHEHKLIPVAMHYVQPFRNVLLAQIKTGSHHTLFLADNGLVYGCGSNNVSQLGVRSDYEKRPIPVQIKRLKHITDIFVGAEHNICVDTLNVIYVFGQNKNGELGLTNNGHMSREGVTVTVHPTFETRYKCKKEKKVIEERKLIV
jgi:alpha-tubulin suppressor-like RCC1 family protein